MKTDLYNFDKVNAKYFISSILQPDNIKISWLPILDVNKDPDIQLGLTKNGLWGININNEFQIVSDNQYLKVMSLLEQPLKSIVEQVEKRFQELEITVDVYELMPISNIITIGLSSDSNYWIELGLDWLDKSPLVIQQKLKDRLIEISTLKGVAQKSRQRAKKMINMLS